MPRDASELVAVFEDGSDSIWAEELRQAPETVWEAIRTLAGRPLTEKQIGLLAAGPLEDLLADHGETFIDRVEREARVYPKFRHLLGGVWPSSIKSHVWDRVVRIRGVAW